MVIAKANKGSGKRGKGWLGLGLLILLMLAARGEGLAREGLFATPALGARGLGMGGAFTALVDDATAAYWNPAALTKLSGTQTVLTSQDLYGIGLPEHYAGLAWPTKGGAVGLAYLVRDFGASSLNVDFDQGWRETLFNFSLARKYGWPGKKGETPLALGANLKYYFVKGGSSELNWKENGFGLDLALAYQGQRYSFALVGRDLLAQIHGVVNEGGKTRDNTTSLVPEFVGGLAWRYRENTTLTVDLVRSNGLTEWRGGVEQVIAPVFTVRAGYGLNHFVAGMTIKAGKWDVDFALGTHAVGETPQLTVKWNF